MNTYKLSKAKANLQVQNPYFALLASQVEIIQSDNQESFTTNGDKLYVNDEYLDSISVEDTQFMLSNAAMHRVLQTNKRQDGKMQWLWQLASDYAINAMLVANDLPLPDRVNYRQRFDGMYAEAIYKELKYDIMNEEFDDNEENDAGHNENNKQKLDEQPKQTNEKDSKQSKFEMEQHEQQIQLDLEQALNEAKKFDNLPKALETLIPKVYEGYHDWHTILQNFVEDLFVSDYSMSKPNKRFLHQGIVLPSLVKEPKKLAIAIDASASINEEQLGMFIAQIEAIRLSVENVDVEVLVCDHRVNSHDTFLYGEPLEVEIKGGGWTDFTPVFEALEDHSDDIAGLIYFTDAQGNFPENQPSYNVLWVLTIDAKVAFGEKVVL